MTTLYAFVVVLTVIIGTWGAAWMLPRVVYPGSIVFCAAAAPGAAGCARGS